MDMTSRRAFLRSALLFGGAAFASPTALAIEPIRRAGSSHIRLSIAGYSMRDYFAGKLRPKMTYEEFIDQAAQWGFDAVELTSYFFSGTDRDYLARLKGRCTRLGLDISGGAVGNDFCVPDPARLKTEIAKVKQWIDHYSLLGAKTVRIFAGSLTKGDKLEAAQARCIESIRECCDHAGKYGIYLALENHGGITTTLDQLLALVQGIKHDWFGVNLDTGHFHSADPYADLARVIPYSVTVQLKTELQREGRKPEELDIPKFIGLLRAANYRGYVALEYEAAEDPKIAIPRYVDALKKLMG